jgi:hypothetical protein
MKRKLRIGLLLDTEKVDAWIYHMLSIIKESDDASFELVLINAAGDPSPSFFKKPQHKYGYLAYNIHRRLDERFTGAHMDAFQAFDIADLIENVPRMEVYAIQTKYSDRFKTEDLKKIKAYKIDVFIRLGFRILRGDILSASKFGIWSYHHADNNVNRGGPPGFWEVAEGWNETGSMLQILTEELDGGKVLYRSFSATDDFSIKRNKINYYWKSLYFLPRSLHMLRELGASEFTKWVQRTNQHPVFYSGRLYTAPTNWQTIRLLSSLIWKKLRHKLWKIFNFDQWVVMYSSTGRQLSHAFFRFKKLYPPKDRFWADPFVITKDGMHYIFVEEFIFRTGVGHIAVLTIDREGKFTDMKIVLQRPYHLSYPFVFEHGNEYFMIPETSANRTIELYRCRNLPDEWEFVMNIMETVEAVDTTLLYRDKKWWMFANMRDHPGASLSDELFLFYSNDLFSQHWTPHPKNPIVSDVKFSRPAGNLFEYNGNLYRPSQNCASRYGHSININHIVTLNEHEYSETTVTSIEPQWDEQLLGTHTINFSTAITVIDALMKRRKWSFLRNA